MFELMQDRQAAVVGEPVEEDGAELRVHHRPHDRTEVSLAAHISSRAYGASALNRRAL
jgi:hypothetical protein